MRILMFFHGGSKNRGCEAIVRSGVAMIKTHFPEVTQLDLSSRDPKSDEIIPLVDTIHLDTIRTIKKYTLDWFRSLVHYKLFKDESVAFQIIHQDIIDKIPDYDVFLSIGGDNYCYGEQPGIYEIDRCIKKGGKKLVLWGASVGQEDLSPPKIEDLKLFDLILVRESITKSILESNGITSVQLCADGAFTMEKEELPLPEGWQEGNTLGFNFSPLVWKMNRDSKDAALQLVKHILDTTDMTIALTPHVVIEGNNDYEVLQQFYNEFKSSNRVILLPDNLNAIQYKGYIARMRFFIGARTHATIAAYSNCVPTMVLGYSVKSKGIAKDIFGYERLVLALDEISDADQLIQKFNELLKDENELKAILNQKIPYIKEMALKAVDYLRKV